MEHNLARTYGNTNTILWIWRDGQTSHADLAGEVVRVQGGAGHGRDVCHGDGGVHLAEGAVDPHVVRALRQRTQVVAAHLLAHAWWKRKRQSEPRVGVLADEDGRLGGR